MDEEKLKLNIKNYENAKIEINKKKTKTIISNLNIF